MILTSLLR
jgi:hypothetical protein